MRQTSKKSDKPSQRRTAKTPKSSLGLPAIVLPASVNEERLPSQPFSEREHVRLLYEAAGLQHDDLKKVRQALLDALQATAAKDIALSLGGENGSKVERVQADLANHDIRLEAADKLLRLFDLFPKKGQSITIEKSNVVVNPKFIKKK